MATFAVAPGDFVDAVASQMAAAVDVAVESWMAEVELALGDPQLTTLGRMNAAKDVLERYKECTGKATLRRRRSE
ncbi:MAG TPA: hypothetical protein VGF06_18085 [Terriglobales bacterium]|jgi:hypothetical protein